MPNYLIQPEADYDIDPDDITNAIWAMGVSDPGTVSGLTLDETYVAREFILSPASDPFTTNVTFTLEVFTGTPVVTGPGEYELTITAPAYLAAYDAGGGAGVYTYNTTELATGPKVLYPGATSGNPDENTNITLTNPPFAVGSGLIEIAYRIVVDGVTVGTTFPYTVTEPATETITIYADITDDNGTTEQLISTLTVQGFNPASLFTGGLKGAWYDPSDTATMWQNTARTIPVTTNNDPVRVIDDKSGNGLHAVAPSDAKRPLYKTSGGLHWLEFDGTDDSMSTSSTLDFSTTSVNNVALCVGALTEGTTSTRLILETGSAGASTEAGAMYLAAPLSGTVFYESYSRGSIGGAGLAAQQTGTGGAPDTAVIFSQHRINYSSTNDDSTLRRNGVAGTPSTGNKGSGPFGNLNLFVGARNNASLFFDGRIYGIFIVGDELTAGERGNIEAWMAAKSGVTL